MTRKKNRGKRYGKKKKDMSKDQSERWHFKPKILERYGMFCNRFMYRAILKLVSDATLLLVQSNTREVHKLLIPLSVFDERSIPKVPTENNTIKVYAVYDSLRHEFCTALPWYATDEELLETLQGEHLYVRG